MSKEELIKELKILIEEAGDGSEWSHIEADNLLLRYINDIEVTNSFNAINKWYS